MSLALSPAVTDSSRTRARRRRSWYGYDWANSGFGTVTGTVLFGPYLTVLAKRDACPGQPSGRHCAVAVHVLGIPVNPGALAFYVVTVSTVVAALVLPLVGAAVDRSRRPVAWLGVLAVLGAGAGGSLAWMSGDAWRPAALLLLVANVCLAASLVVYDALLCRVADPSERDAVSSRGWALGYLGGGILLALDLALVSGHAALGLTTESAVRLSLLSAGLWWGGFTLIPVLGLRDLPSEPEDHGKGPAAVDGRAPVAAAGKGPGPAPGVGLRATLADLRTRPATLGFLLAYLVYNDGIQTVITSSAVFGQEELGMDSADLMVTTLLVQFVAFAGALGFGMAAARIGAKRAVLAGLAVWIAIAGAASVLPAGRLGLFLLLAAAIGSVLGGTQALSRSLFSRLVPPERSAEYFALYQCAERGTSWSGTLVFGVVFQLSGSYRWSILLLGGYFAVGAALLSRVDVAAGSAAALGAPPETGGDAGIGGGDDRAFGGGVR